MATWWGCCAAATSCGGCNCTRTWRREHMLRRVRGGLPDVAAEQYAARIPPGRIGRPEEIPEAVVWRAHGVGPVCSPAPTRARPRAQGDAQRPARQDRAEQSLDEVVGRGVAGQSALRQG